MIGWLLLPLVLFVILLALAGSGCCGLTLEKTIKLSDFPTLAATTLIAIVLQYVLLKRGKVTDTEKEILNRQVLEAVTTLGDIRSLVGQSVGKRLSSEEATSLVTAFEACSEALDSLGVSVENSHCGELSGSCRDIENHFLLYKRIITGDDFPATPLAIADLERSRPVRNKIQRGLHRLSLEVARA